MGSNRLIALDTFRGMTIALMIVVNTPGTWAHVYAPLRHAKWHGCTPTDLVFPFFLFIVGVAMRFSFKRFDFILSPEITKKFWAGCLPFLRSVFYFQPILSYVRIGTGKIFGSWEFSNVSEYPMVVLLS